MKHLITTALFLFVLHETFAQNINLGLNFTDAGRNITVQYDLVRQKNEYSFGLGVNINKLAHNDNQNNFYKKRLFAIKPIHFINFNITYQRYV